MLGSRSSITRACNMSSKAWIVWQAGGVGSKRGPGLGSFSRADRGIGGVRPVAPPPWLVSNFLAVSRAFLADGALK